MVLALGALFCSCRSDSLDGLARARAAQAETGKKRIVVGVVWPSELRKDFFLHGLQLALEEINEQGLLGRDVKLLIRDDHNNYQKAREIALSFAHNTEMTAVIGHAASGVTLPVSVIYNKAGLLFINTASTNSTLSRHGLDMFFRIVPDNSAFAKHAALYTYLMGYRKPVIIYVRGYYGKDLSNLYQAFMGKLGVSVVRQYGFFPGDTDWRPIFRQLKNLDYDIIFVGASVPECIRLIAQARTWGLTAPVIGSDGFDAHRMLSEGGDAVEGVMYCGVYNPASAGTVNRAFVEKFQKKYGQMPDTEAAQAYDALSLLACAVRKTKSTNPAQLAANLNYVERWEGATGSHSLDEHGDVVDKPIYFKQIVDHKARIVDFAPNQLQALQQQLGGLVTAGNTADSSAGRAGDRSAGRRP